MNFYEMAENVNSKESFLQFVEALAEDAEVAFVESKRTPEDKLNLSPRGWENGSVPAFLGAMASWASSNSGDTGEPMVPEQPSWRAFAEILHSGRFYE